jgi:hypothetical protein
VLHLDAAGHENWIDLAVPGASLTSANSVYQGTVIGLYTGTDGATNGYIVNVPGIYDPIRNSGTLTIGGNDTPAIAAVAATTSSMTARSSPPGAAVPAFAPAPTV